MSKPLFTFPYCGEKATLDIMNSETCYFTRPNNKNLAVFKNDEKCSVFRAAISKMLDFAFYREMIVSLLTSLVEVAESIFSKFQELEIMFMNILKFDSSHIEMHANLSLKNLNDKIYELQNEQKYAPDKEKLRIARKINVNIAAIATYNYYIKSELPFIKGFLGLVEEEYRRVKLESQSANINGIPIRTLYSKLFLEFSGTVFQYTHKIRHFFSKEFSNEEKDFLWKQTDWVHDSLNSFVEFSKKQNEVMTDADVITEEYFKQSQTSAKRIASVFVSNFINIYKEKISQAIYLLRSQLLQVNNKIPIIMKKANDDYPEKLKLRSSQLTSNKNLLNMFNSKPPQRRNYTKISACQQRISKLEAEVKRLTELVNLAKLRNPSLKNDLLVSKQIGNYITTMQDYISDNGLVGFFKQNFIIEFSVKVHCEFREPPHFVFDDIPQMNNAKKTFKIQELRDIIHTKLTDYEALLEYCDPAFVNYFDPQHLLPQINGILQAERVAHRSKNNEQIKEYDNQITLSFKELTKPMQNSIPKDAMGSLTFFIAFFERKLIATGCMKKKKNKLTGFNEHMFQKKLDRIRMKTGSKPQEVKPEDFKQILMSKKIWFTLHSRYPNLSLIIESKEKPQDRKPNYLIIRTFEQIQFSLAEFTTRFFLIYFEANGLSIPWKNKKNNG